MVTSATMAGQSDGKMKAQTASLNLSHLKLISEVKPGCGVKHLRVLSWGGGCRQTSLPPLSLAVESTDVVHTLLPELGGRFSEVGRQTALSVFR